jgi:hypothetical protein
MKSVPYAGLAIGSLMHTMVATRPDIAHAVGVVSRFMHNPDRPHCNAMNEAYLQIFGWHTRLRHQIRTEQTMWPSWLYRLGLRGLSREPEIDVRILLQVRVRRHFVEIETSGFYGYKYDQSGVRSCVGRSEGSTLARTTSLYISTS